MSTKTSSPSKNKDKGECPNCGYSSPYSWICELTGLRYCKRCRKWFKEGEETDDSKRSRAVYEDN